jgi:hypothetical protein
MEHQVVGKCAHPKCHCNVEIENQFCSLKCANANQSARAQCLCGHPECVGEDQAIKYDEFDPLMAEP